MWAILLPRAVFVSVVLLRRVVVWMGSVLPLKAILRSMVWSGCCQRPVLTLTAMMVSVVLAAAKDCVDVHGRLYCHMCKSMTHALLTGKKEEASFAMALMTARSQLRMRNTEGFCDPSTPYSPSPK